MHYLEAESQNIFCGGGTAPSTAPTPPQTQPHSAPAAPRPVFANPPVIFFTILTLRDPNLCVLDRCYL